MLAPCIFHCRSTWSRAELLQLVPARGEVLMQTHVASEPTIFSSPELVVTVPRLRQLGFEAWKSSGSTSVQELAVRSEIAFTVNELRDVDAMREQVRRVFNELMQKREDLRIDFQRAPSEMPEEDMYALRKRQIDQTANEIQIVAVAQSLVDKRNAALLRCARSVRSFGDFVRASTQDEVEVEANTAQRRERLTAMLEKLCPEWDTAMVLPEDLRLAIETDELPTAHPEDLIVLEANEGVIGRPLRESTEILDRLKSNRRSDQQPAKSWWSWWFY